MDWASRHMEMLRSGQAVEFRPRGGSMRPRIESGQLVRVEPRSDEEVLAVGTIVLCRVKGRSYLHLIKAIRGEGERRQFLIANARGRENGWIGGGLICGICSRVGE